MTLLEILRLFSTFDLAAAGAALLFWQGCSILAEHPPKNRLSTSVLMARYRMLWMREFVTRDPRIFDAQIMGNLRSGAAFFASATMIAIGGALALVGNADMLRGIARDLTLEAAPVIVWEIKLIFTLIFVVNAFLKFVWSHRLFGYCSILMAAVPNDVTNPKAYDQAAQAGQINIKAARSYNRGLRGVFFGIASTAWLISAPALLITTTFTLLVVMRREFASQSRMVLLSDTDDTANTDT